MGSQRNNHGILNLTILFLCSAIFAATLIFPGVSSFVSDEIDFGMPCNETHDTHNRCKHYSGTVGCINATQEENEKEPSKICDCIWNNQDNEISIYLGNHNMGKYVLENETECVGLVYSFCSTSFPCHITCVDDAYCNNEICSCPENSSPNQDWDHCLINFNQACSQEEDKCNPHSGTVSCQQVGRRNVCDCDMNIVEENYIFNYTLFNGTCVGLVNSPCGKIGDYEVGCVNGAKCRNFTDPRDSVCECDIFHVPNKDRQCENNKDAVIIPVPTEIGYGTACFKEPNHVEKCKRYDHDQVACVNRYLNKFKPNRCDCKGNDNIPLEQQGNYVWDKDTESCLGYVRSPCNPNQTHNCIDNAECGKDYSGETVCLCVSGYEEHFDRVCNVTAKIVVSKETPNTKNHSNSIYITHYCSNSIYQKYLTAIFFFSAVLFKLHAINFWRKISTLFKYHTVF